MSKELVERLRNRNERYQGGFGNALMYIGSDAILDCKAADEIERLDGIIDKMSESLETAMDFIDSNVADPDLTPEMWSYYRKLDHLEPRLLLDALSKAHKVKE